MDEGALCQITHNYEATRALHPREVQMKRQFFCPFEAARAELSSKMGRKLEERARVMFIVH